MNLSTKRFVRVYRAANSVEAHLIRGMLEQHGISVRILGDGLASGIGELPMDVVQVEVQVPPGFSELARQLIDEYERGNREGVSTTVVWRCASCGEDCPDEFALCWNCGAESPGGS